ncbi:MAG: hypothetical protein C7B46_20095 [Sulfobacillus benefaciens]|uniref:Thioredoxin domain-containing protein n=1 Tax=Sulfobacillus benefaciens TaxID=453960 RepID=A0A2T2WVM7_9FIRM|nr:MAG: hypothetical protein C7B46_20095 [Sulfobacillus benefaciens]
MSRFWRVLAAFGLATGMGAGLIGCGTATVRHATPSAAVRSSVSPPTSTASDPPSTPALWTLSSGLLSTTGSPVSLTLGSSGGLIAFVNPASPLSAYTIRWTVVPHLSPGVALTIVLALPATTVATPGPVSPPYTGQSGDPAQAQSVGVIGALAPSVARIWHLPPQTTIDTVAPTTLLHWQITAFPTLWVVNTHQNRVAQLIGGVSAQTLSTALDALSR